MCIFSGRVSSVGATRIFARFVAPGVQALVYEMRVAAPDDVAMVLPVPAVGEARFVSLEAYPDLFDDLDAAFPQYLAFGVPQPAALPVQDVGAYQASFVPSPADFARLDPRFRLPDAVIASVPAYADWSFCVFQLRASARPAQVHPMAFTFPTRRPDALFFPTLHVHDGALHPTARFDHTLYSQGVASADEASEAVGATVDAVRAAGLVDPAAPAHRRRLVGISDNRDHWV